MDRKSIIILVACFLLLVSWPVLLNKIYPPKPLPPGSTNAPAAQASAVSNPAASSAVSAEAAPAVVSNTALVFTMPGAPETLVDVTNDNAHYTFTSHGGGLKSVELVKFRESVAGRGAKNSAGPRVELNTMSATPVLTILGGPAVEGDGIFRLTPTSAGVRAEKTLSNGLSVVKDFQATSNYLVTATVRLRNTSATPLTLPAQEWVIGTSAPMGPDDTGLTVGMLWYDGARSAEITLPWFDNKSWFRATEPRPEYQGGSNNVVWAAVHNQFFALAAMPKEPAFEVVSRPVHLARPASWPLPSNGRPAPVLRGEQTAFAYPALTLAPGKEVARQITFFAGPKEYRTLAHIADRFNNNVDLVMGFGGFFGWFAKLLLLSMNGLHDMLRLGYGWIIILITFIIKLLFWPLTQASTRSMKRMQALQPQMNALKEKYKDDPAKMNKKLMEFMKENKVSPMGGCLPMMIQLPIFFGFYRMIQSAIELRGESFLWVRDLSKPDTLFRIPGLDMPFNLLPLIMGGTMLWQAQMTPATPGMDPAQQKMMKYMPLIFLFMLYNFSAGLTLYWTVQNLLTIAQMKLTRAQDKTGGTPPGPAPGSRKKI